MEEQAVVFAKNVFQKAVFTLIDLGLCGESKTKEAEDTRKLARCMARAVAERGGRVRPFNCEAFRESLRTNLEILHGSRNANMRSKARRDLWGKLHVLEEITRKYGNFKCLNDLKEEILKSLGGNQAKRAKRTRNSLYAA